MNWYLFIYLWSLTHHPVPRPVYYPPPVVRPVPVIQPVVVTPTCEWTSTGAYGSKATCVVPPPAQATTCSISGGCVIVQPPCLPMAAVCA